MSFLLSHLLWSWLQLFILSSIMLYFFFFFLLLVSFFLSFSVLYLCHFFIYYFISNFLVFFSVYLRYAILTSGLAYTKLLAKISIAMFATSKIAAVRIPSNGWLLPAVTRISESTKNGWSMTWMIPFVHSTSGRNTGMFRWFHWIE